MADRGRGCITEDGLVTSQRPGGARCRGLAGVALLACFTAALSLYYLGGLTDQGRHRGAVLVGPAASHRYQHHQRPGPAVERYLVHGRKCRIQDVDPYDEEVRAFIKTVQHVPCSRLPPLTRLVKRDGYSELHVEAEATRAYSPNGVTCCYSAVTRPPRESKPDDSIAVSECRPFDGGGGQMVNTTDEFVIVRCATRNRKKEVYRNAYATVHVRAKVRARLDATAGARLAAKRHAPLSVLLVGVDSVSRLNALRALPLTTALLRKHGWTELLGYNKIADNTYPNLMAVLTGIDGERSYEECLPTMPYRLDNCSLLWRRYREHGYATAYAEDEPNISTFNFLKVGFVRPPTDHYLRPFMLAAQREMRTVERHSLKYCLGPVSAGERVLHYAEDFATTYVNDTSFGLFWTNSFSHNDLNSPSGMDAVLADFFARLHERRVTERSLVVFLSDHGMRFGDVRQTKVGWLEERLPVAWLSVPQWFKQRHPVEWRALRGNAARLTTPYDLHMTLQHVLTMEDVEGTQGLPRSTGCPDCQSLFTEVNVDRSCEDAAISPHWCVCTAFREVNVHDAVVQAAARFVVNRVTAYVREGDLAAAEGAVRKCATLTLSRILIAQRGNSWDGRHTYYLLFVETLPGRGRYEATVSVPANNASTAAWSDSSFELHSSISRLDTYAGQSRCINSAFLRKYCYCR